MKQIHRLIIWSVMLFVVPMVVLAQNDSCPAIVETALNTVDEVCQSAGRNQACYGHFALEAELQSDITSLAFEQAGDIIDVGDLQAMRLSPLNEAAGEWGVALMRLQANIPDSIPGQNVTFLLFGDVEIVTAVGEHDDADLNPMQSFYLTTGVGASGCEEAPQNGLLVQTPEGVNEVAFTVNGVDIAMGSTIFFESRRGREMVVSALEGAAVLNYEGSLHTVIAGTRLRMPIDDELRPRGIPTLPESYEQRQFTALPIRLLQRRIDIAPPLPQRAITLLQQRVFDGELPCGVGLLPSCDDLPIQRLMSCEGDDCAGFFSRDCAIGECRGFPRPGIRSSGNVEPEETYHQEMLESFRAERREDVLLSVYESFRFEVNLRFEAERSELDLPADIEESSPDLQEPAQTTDDRPPPPPPGGGPPPPPPGDGRPPPPRPGG